MTKRARVPWPPDAPIVFAPLTITDADADARAKTGLSGRALRRFVKEHGVRARKEGRRLIIDAEDYIAKVRELAAGARRPTELGAGPEDDDAVDSEDAAATAARILEHVGLR